LEVVDTRILRDATWTELAASMRSSRQAVALESHLTTVVVTDQEVLELDGLVGIDPSSRRALHVSPTGLNYLPLDRPYTEPITIDGEPSIHAAQFNGDGSVLAVSRPAAAIAIYSGDRLVASNPLVRSIAGTEETRGSFGRVAFRVVKGSVIREDGDSLKTLYEAPPDSVAEIASVSPGGDRAVVTIRSPGASSSDPDTIRTLLVGPDAKVQSLGTTCPLPGGFEFRPGAQMRTSVADATAARLVQVEPADGDPVVTDCLSGQRLTDLLPTVFDYNLDGERGRILFRETKDNETNYTLLQWDDGSKAPTVTVVSETGAGPAPVLNETTTHATVWDSDASEIRVRTLREGRWEDALTLIAGTDEVRWSKALPDLGLLVAVGADSSIEMFDLDSGRTLLHHRMETQGTGEVYSGETSIRSGALRVTLLSSDGTGGTSHSILEVPVAVDVLRERLCSMSPSSCQ
jgi:hypothetical protein